MTITISRTQSRNDNVILTLQMVVSVQLTVIEVERNRVTTYVVKTTDLMTATKLFQVTVGFRRVRSRVNKAAAVIK